MSQDPESHELSDRPGADCWSEVKKETGFATYKEFLDEYITGCVDDTRSLKKFRAMLDHEIPHYASELKCSLFDFSETGSLSTSLESPESLKSPYDYSTKLINALRHPPQQISFRILLVDEHSPYPHAFPGLIDAVGLGLRIWPDFFEAYIARNKFFDRNPISWTVPLKARHATIGRLVFTIARDYLSGVPSCPPVMLIMGHPGFLEGVEFRPIDNKSAHFTKPAAMFSNCSEEKAWQEIFEHLFKRHMKQYKSTSLDMDGVVICTLLSLLERHLDELKAEYDGADDRYLNALMPWDPYSLVKDLDHEHMEQVRFTLRRLVRYAEQSISVFKRYSQAQGIMKPERALRNIIKDVKPWLDDARALEAEIRDKLQLQVGSLALEESKKSIQMSNIQIEESKRVKVVTILAFVYVPLNLATSIFGMNIQQLNQSGQQIRVFLLTAFVALLLTFFIWFCIAQITAYVQWREQYNALNYHEAWPKRGKDYNFIIRVAILYMLLREKLYRWTWISGAWIRILTNERTGLFLDFADPHNAAVQEFCDRENTACDYVCRHMKDVLYPWFLASAFKRKRSTNESTSTSQTSSRLSAA